ncbi:MAG: type II secretion system protein [Candidatus Brocadiia bacterium]
MRRHARTGARRGFTLVELLVVIGVIAVLASLLMSAVVKAQASARRAACRSNLSQVFKSIRIYGNSWDNLLPDLYAGLAVDTHNARYRQSHYCRSTDPNGNEVPAGLWLLKPYVKDTRVLFCPQTPGWREPGRSGNPVETVQMPGGETDEVPREVGYAYNCFPDAVPDDQSPLPPPEQLDEDDVANDLSLRAHRFYALLADVFLNDYLMTHGAKEGLNVGYSDGAVQWVSLGTTEVPWNTTDTFEGEEVETFSEDMTGYEAVRDAWVHFSEGRE